MMKTRNSSFNIPHDNMLLISANQSLSGEGHAYMVDISGVLLCQYQGYDGYDECGWRIVMSGQLSIR